MESEQGYLKLNDNEEKMVAESGVMRDVLRNESQAEWNSKKECVRVWRERN